MRVHQGLGNRGRREAVGLYQDGVVRGVEGLHHRIGGATMKAEVDLSGGRLRRRQGERQVKQQGRYEPMGQPCTSHRLSAFGGDGMLGPAMPRRLGEGLFALIYMATSPWVSIDQAIQLAPAHRLG